MGSDFQGHRRAGYSLVSLLRNQKEMISLKKHSPSLQLFCFPRVNLGTWIFLFPWFFQVLKTGGSFYLKKNGIFSDSHIQKTGNDGVAAIRGDGGVRWACPIMPISLPYSSSPLPLATAGLWGIWHEHPCSIPSIHSNSGSRRYSSRGKGFKETFLDWSIFSSSRITLEFPWLPCETAWLLQNTTKNTKT